MVLCDTINWGQRIPPSPQRSTFSSIFSGAISVEIPAICWVRVHTWLNLYQIVIIRLFFLPYENSVSCATYTVLGVLNQGIIISLN